MAHTNSTENYGLPQWIGTDKPTFLGDFNSAFGTIDTQMKSNADASASAVATANSASAVASSANTNANTALSTANEAKTDAASAVTTAGTANTKATQAQTDASNALRASAANTIENLAPAYDNTLTYQVGDLCTYVDAQNSGRLYKCIVPVNTPMDFNINYWDDVTTSEVYAQKSMLISSVTADGVMTYKEMLNALIANVDIDYSAEYLLVAVTSSTHNSKYHEVLATDGLLSFTFVAASTSEMQGFEYHLDKNGNSTYYHTVINSNGFSGESRTNNVVTSGVTWQLFKLNTM